MTYCFISEKKKKKILFRSIFRLVTISNSKPDRNYEGFVEPVEHWKQSQSISYFILFDVPTY